MIRMFLPAALVPLLDGKLHALKASRRLIFGDSAVLSGDVSCSVFPKVGARSSFGTPLALGRLEELRVFLRDVVVSTVTLALELLSEEYPRDSLESLRPRELDVGNADPTSFTFLPSFPPFAAERVPLGPPSIFPFILCCRGGTGSKQGEVE